MNKIQLSNTSKKLLKALYNDEDWGNIPDATDAQIVGAAQQLKELGFVRCVINYGEILCIEIKTTGRAYVEEYPELGDPANVEIEELTKQNLILQNNELEHKIKIRQQEGIIRLWQVVSAVLGLASLILVFLAFFKY